MSGASAPIRGPIEMLRIACPFCGSRDEVEFRYRGDAGRGRPAPEAGEEAFAAYVYERDNPAGWHQEWEVGMQQMIEDELLLRGTKTPKDVVLAMKDSWETLRSKYAP